MRRNLLVIALLVCAASVAEERAPEGYDDTWIEIGRYGLMLEQVRGLTNSHARVENPDVRLAMARSLRSLVWQNNLQRAELCEQHLFVKLSCAAAYLPAWIAESANTKPTWAELQSRADDIGAQVTPFWDAVCENVKAKLTDPTLEVQICGME